MGAGGLPKRPGRRDRGRVGVERDTEATAGSGRQRRRRRPPRRGRRGQENGAGGGAQEAGKQSGRAGSGRPGCLSERPGPHRGRASDSGGGGRPGVSRRLPTSSPVALAVRSGSHYVTNRSDLFCQDRKLP